LLSVCFVSGNTTNSSHIIRVTVPCRLSRNATQLAVTVACLWETASPPVKAWPQEHDISQERGPPRNYIPLRNYHSSSQPILPCRGPGGRPIVGLFGVRSGFDHKSVLMLQFLSEYVVFSPSTSVFPLSVPRHQCSILHLHVALTRRANEQSLGTFQKVILSRKSGSTGQNIRLTWSSNG
jgi:hypothetical protein